MDWLRSECLNRPYVQKHLFIKAFDNYSQVAELFSEKGAARGESDDRIRSSADSAWHIRLCGDGKHSSYGTDSLRLWAIAGGVWMAGAEPGTVKRKLYMHVAVTVGLLGFLGTAMSLINVVQLAQGKVFPYPGGG